MHFTILIYIIPVQLVTQGLLQTKCDFTLDHYFDVLDAARLDGYEIGPLCDFHRTMETSKKYCLITNSLYLC